ncbi:hypothetical protein PG985_010285 [Apiospora marii]|uniref:uncharacterized protein n=1 Tax=Apiospora marii TaxID=335849 RepID=UPI0031311A3D
MSTESHQRHSSPPSYTKPLMCLSSEPHAISDHMLHYLGCLQYCERESLFEENNEIWKEEIKHHERMFPNSRTSPEDHVKKKREIWRKDCEEELARVAILREAVKDDVRNSHLDKSIRDSSKKWMAYKGRQGRPPTNNTPQAAKYNLEKDINIPIVQYQLRGGGNRAARSEEERGLEGEANPDQRVWGDFPDQETNLNVLGKDPDVNLLSQDRHPDRIKYFHLPSNNMINALSRYFGEERPDRQATRRELGKPPNTRAAMLLRDPFWQGRLQGGEADPPHARYMRPICVTASSEPQRVDITPRNLVLFMPFLHWETSRQRGKYAQAIRRTVHRNKRREYQEQMDMKRKRIDVRNAAHPGFSSPNVWLGAPEKSENSPVIESFADAIPRIYFPNALPVDKYNRYIIKHPLGQYLLDAARLYEGMSNYRDQTLVKNYLGGETCLHVRRTLDQAYYWTLNKTERRDRDQVVYRATTVQANHYHQYDRERARWPQHEDFRYQGDCPECARNIREVSRVIMVDQLWLWILDEKTIITCFPNRYGVRNHDTSGVHQSIKRRLEVTPQIRTVFDLGLVILDECSNVFFDRTTVDTSQPSVVDIFSTAIGEIVSTYQRVMGLVVGKGLTSDQKMLRYTLAFERLWQWTQHTTKIDWSNSNSSSRLGKYSINIDFEGGLKREIQDIIEELDIMLHTIQYHRTVLKQYVHSVEKILSPHSDFGYGRATPETDSNCHGAPFLTENHDTDSQQSIPQGTDTTSEKGFKEKGYRKQDYDWFKLKADELSGLVEERIAELFELRAAAVSTADNVKDILDLKQQQAGVVQAWQAVGQAAETIKQGRSIMVFTFVTIVFVSIIFENTHHYVLTFADN